MEGFVYILRHGVDDNLIKVGFSNEPVRRGEELFGGNPRHFDWLTSGKWPICDGQRPSPTLDWKIIALTTGANGFSSPRRIVSVMWSAIPTTCQLLSKP